MKKNNSEIAMWSEETHIFEVDKSLIMEKDVETKKQISKLMKEGEKFMKKKDLVCAENIYQKMHRAYDSLITADSGLYEKILEFNTKIINCRK